MAEPTVNLRAPGHGYRLLGFSDGTSAWMPPEATIDDWTKAKEQGEATRDQKYMAQAEAQNAPVTTKGKVYSATHAYPAGVHGQLIAWMDHHLGLNAVNRSQAWQTVEPYVAPVSGAISRIGTAAIETNPYVRAVDLGTTGYNIAKHLAAKVVPQLANVPDSQSILGLTRAALGTPQLDPNAPAAQRIAENVASMSLNPSSWNKTALLDTTLRAGASDVGGNVGEYFGGEAGQALGSFAGAPRRGVQSAPGAPSPRCSGARPRRACLRPPTGRASSRQPTPWRTQWAVSSAR